MKRVGLYFLASLGVMFLIFICSVALRVGNFPKKVEASTERKIALHHGQIIGASLVIYAYMHGGRLPDSLEDLIPDLVGRAVPVKDFQFSYSGRQIRLLAADVLIAQELNPAGRDFVCIRADGTAYLLKKGD